MTSNHLFKFSTLTPQEKTEGGTRKKASKENFAALVGMSLYKINLNKGGVREPHWHANADELGYCLTGEAIISLYDTNDTKATFLIQAGDAYFIPSGALHDIENVGAAAAEIVACFNSDQVEDFGLSGTLGAFSNAVLGNTWNVKETVFEDYKRDTTNVFARINKSQTSIPNDARYATPYSFKLESSAPLITNNGGSARMARKNVWPIVKDLALYSLILTGSGMREPHWHPETAELGFIKSGQGRMSILNPAGFVDTYIMEEGDIYFIPKAYPHHIENLKTDEDLSIMIFFDQEMPKDVGLTASVRSYSDEVLATITEQNPLFFEQLKKYYRDAFIVNKINPS